MRTPEPACSIHISLVWEHSNIQQGSEGLTLGFSCELADPFHVFGGLQGTDIDLGQTAEGDRKGNLIGGGFRYIQQTLPRGLDEYGRVWRSSARRRTTRQCDTLA